MHQHKIIFLHLKVYATSLTQQAEFDFCTCSREKPETTENSEKRGKSRMKLSEARRADACVVPIRPFPPRDLRKGERFSSKSEIVCFDRKIKAT